MLENDKPAEPSVQTNGGDVINSEGGAVQKADLIKIDAVISQGGAGSTAIYNDHRTFIQVPPAPSPSSERQRNYPDLHQTYLKKLVEQVGTVRLSLINPQHSGDIYLEAVYVDSPTPLAISVEVQDWRIVDWWLSRTDQPNREREISEPAFGAKKGDMELTRPRPEQFGYKRAPLEVLVKELRLDDYYYWNNGIEENVISLHLNKLAAVCSRLVIIGAPGSGKSSFVRYLALALAGSGIEGWHRPVTTDNLPNWQAGTLTPVYIELRRFVASKHFPQNISEGATADHLWHYLETELSSNGLSAYAEDLRYDLEHGQAILLLDGLDEVPYPEGKLRQRQSQLIQLAHSIDTRFGQCRVIVTSRPYAYEGWSLPNYQPVNITAFEDEHRIALAEKLYRAADKSPEEAENMAQKLNEQLENIDPELKDRPLFVTLMASIYLNNLKEGKEGLPTKRGALYRESILLLLDRWTQSKPEAPSLVEILGDKTKQDLYVRLAALAYEVHKTEETSKGRQAPPPDIGYGQLTEHFKKLGRHVPPDLIPYLCENAGVLVSPGQDDEANVFQFAHRTFQEYLAAEHLVSLCQKADSFVPVREHITTNPDKWRVPGAFVGDILTDTDRKRDLWQLLGDLLEDDSPQNKDDLRWWAAWLAAKIAQEQEMYTQEKLHRLNEQPIKDALVDWLVALLGTAQALPPIERAEGGRVLALLGDPRPGVGTKPALIAGKTVELPDIEWCEIPAPPNGKFIMGADDQGRNPRREVALNYGFRMSKYPITYKQYQAFIDSGDYANPQWWQGFPEEYQPQPMTAQYFRYANHPRDRVSWYQAVAFTRWLTVLYRAQGGLLNPNEEVRLPTEKEWEYAARGTEERVYPYGNKFDETKGNTWETGIAMTSAVGLFADGASPFGVQDMSGNVWEWCLNKYDDLEDTSIDKSTRSLRGGAYGLNSVNAACVYRVGNDPNDYFVYHLGFRVVAPLISASAL